MRLVFPLGGAGSGGMAGGFPWDLDDSGGVGDSGASGRAIEGRWPLGALASAALLPAAPEEIMWRVARASMGEQDWDTAILALKELAASGGKGQAAGAGVDRG